MEKDDTFSYLKNSFLSSILFILVMVVVYDASRKRLPETLQVIIGTGAIIVISGMIKRSIVKSSGEERIAAARQIPYFAVKLVIFVLIGLTLIKMRG